MVNNKIVFFGMMILKGQEQKTEFKQSPELKSESYIKLSSRKIVLKMDFLEFNGKKQLHHLHQFLKSSLDRIGLRSINRNSTRSWITQSMN